MRLTTKAEIEALGAELVGPIAEGETPEQAIYRAEHLFGGKVDCYAFTMYDEPLTGPDQQYPVIVGSYYAARKKDMVFRLQLLRDDQWFNVNDEFKSRIPNGVDVLGYVKRVYPASDFRVVYVQKGQN